MENQEGSHLIIPLFTYSYWVFHVTLFFLSVYPIHYFKKLTSRCMIYTWVKMSKPSPLYPPIAYWKQMEKYTGSQWIKNSKFMWIFTFILLCSPFTIYWSHSNTIPWPFNPSLCHNFPMPGFGQTIKRTR